MFSSTLLSALLLSGASAVALPATPTSAAVQSLAPEASLISAPMGLSIHSSCSVPETHQLQAALEETAEFLTTAQTHILTHGRTSPVYQKYFGNSSTAEPLGWFTRALYAQKPGALFRCDDADQNCANNPTWAGHHRGDNATEETVICPPSYTTRLSLTKMCYDGYTVAGNETNVFWASDLFHRMLHVPGVSEGVVEHWTHDLQETLVMAKNVTDVRRGSNSDSLIYFALEVYAEDVAVPGVGCAGEVEEKEEEHEHTETTATATTVPEASATDAEAGKDCHTHDDGSLHCV